MELRCTRATTIAYKGVSTPQRKNGPMELKVYVGIIRAYTGVSTPQRKNGPMEPRICNTDC